MPKKNNNQLISKDDFINFLASSSPEEINDYIIKKGKPLKIYEAMIFDDTKEENKNARAQHSKQSD